MKLWLSCLETEPLRLTRADPAKWQTHASWQPLLTSFWQSQAGMSLQSFLNQRIADGARIFPPEPMRALWHTPLTQVRVVLLGQDPYHGQGQAEGLSFSVPDGVAVPPSLRNIFKELHTDLGMQPPMSGSLLPWAKQGVLLLNTCLTVEEGRAASHAGRGWELLTDAIIRAVAEQPHAAVFLLWGVHAQAKRLIIEAARAGEKLLLSANHPSPLSALRGPAPFIGCRHFSTSQSWLSAQDVDFKWDLEK